MNSCPEYLGALFAWAPFLLCLGLKIWGSANEVVQAQGVCILWQLFGIFFSVVGLIYEKVP